MRERAETAIRIATTGTIEEIEALESREGCALSSLLDDLAAAAAEEDLGALAADLDAAFAHLTGRTP